MQGQVLAQALQPQKSLIPFPAGLLQKSQTCRYGRKKFSEVVP